MNEELTEKLVTKYPKLYKQNIYFECGDGWYDLIDKLSEKLEEKIFVHPDESIVTCCAQVKEKFGGLRFYMYFETDEMSDLINQAEDKSTSICELCGKPGTTRHINRWYKTICQNC